MREYEVLEDNEKTQVLTYALPYIQKYFGKTIVVKYGGNAMINEELKKAVINDLILMKCIGVNVVLVHGGGPEISSFLKKIGKESKFIDGLRYTDGETMEIVQMVLAGKINKDLVALINKNGGKALGLCGIDGNMIQAKKLEIDGKDLGWVGEVEKVNTQIILDVINMGYIPVIGTVAVGEDGEVYNINADTAASKISTSLNAEKLVLLTDVPGILRDAMDSSTLISSLKIDEVPPLISKGVLHGGMIPKVNCCVDAVTAGVKRAHIIDGRVPHSILLELFSEEGKGTMIE